MVFCGALNGGFSAAKKCHFFEVYFSTGCGKDDIGAGVTLFVL
jgi:hypothetical protein